ncbi:Major Facilitator Superfamily protein [Haloarcula vallismortis]|uniref:Major Facilitator Superfamily protein n=1 Tax=Haloarcula vallismortis TaxID=28442 RepID=A0A1H2TIK7_HALVA|nr:MFS transporter [Haloarcula vallismortis]SDW43783.1 Major Facilitator Superfamily protein [Haloarcula vallismortis]
MLGPVSDSGLVRRYYLYRATIAVGFITPVFTLFLLRTLTFTQVGALSATYSAFSAVGEIPTGYVGDRLGRRASLLLSVFFTVLSLTGFIFASGFFWYCLLYLLWALALTFRSGSMDAWLYDILSERLDSGQFSHVRGRGDAVQNWTAAVSMVIGGLLYGLHPTYPFIATVVFNSLGSLALLSLPKNRQYTDRGGDSCSGDRLEPLETISVIRTALARPPLRALVLYIGLFYSVLGVAHSYVQPMVVETLGPYAAGIGVQVPAGGAITAARAGEAGAALALGLGVLYAAMTAVSSAGGYYAGAIEERLGVRKAVIVVPALTAVVLVVPLWIALVALPAFATMRTAKPLVQPIANGYISDHVEMAGRATLLSAVSMSYMGLRAPLALAAGMVADTTTATTAVAALGGLFLAAGGAVWLLGEIAPETATASGDRASKSA